MYVVMDDSTDQMCYFKRLRKPRIAEDRTTPVLRNKAERPEVQSNGLVSWLFRRGRLLTSSGSGWREAGTFC